MAFLSVTMRVAELIIQPTCFGAGCYIKMATKSQECSEYKLEWASPFLFLLHGLALPFWQHPWQRTLNEKSALFESYFENQTNQVIAVEGDIRAFGNLVRESKVDSIAVSLFTNRE